MANHDDSCSESRRLCDELFTRLAKRIPLLERGPTEAWCGLYRDGRKRFAWVSHRKRDGRIQVWCLGDAPSFERLGPAVRYTRRQTPQKKGWGKYFQGCVDIESERELQAAVDAFFSISYDLS
jgi:hypothetical protein